LTEVHGDHRTSLRVALPFTLAILNIEFTKKKAAGNDRNGDSMRLRRRVWALVRGLDEGVRGALRLSFARKLGQHFRACLFRLV